MAVSEILDNFGMENFDFFDNIHVDYDDTLNNLYVCVTGRRKTVDVLLLLFMLTRMTL